MPVPARRSLGLISLIVVLLAALALAGCSRIVGPRSWTATAQRIGGGSYLIDVSDTSGRVDGLEIDPPGLGVVGGVINPPGQPNVVVVPWTGGACDERTDIAIAPNGQGLAISIATRVLPGVCDAIGVEHTLRITSGQPLPAAAVTVTSAPATGG